eukprot:14492350-Heterocapsa_arctica.AAC.1
MAELSSTGLLPLMRAEHADTLSMYQMMPRPLRMSANSAAQSGPTMSSAWPMYCFLNCQKSTTS